MDLIVRRNRAEGFINPASSFLLNLGQPSTMSTYREAVEDFLTLVGPLLRDVSDIKREHLILYVKELERRGLAANTVQKKLSAVASFCRHLAQSGYLDRDVTYGVRRPKAENKKETGDIADCDVKKIFASLNPERRSYTLHKTLLAMGFYSGLRSSEIRNLKIKNIGMVSGVKILSLRIKGNKKHEIPLHPFVISCLDEHLTKMKDLGFNTEDPETCLFLSFKTKKLKPMSAVALSYIFKKAIEQSGISLSDFRRYSPHSMRATFASHLLNTLEVPLEDVQKSLGHANPSTTQRYNKRAKSHDKSPVFKIDY